MSVAKSVVLFVVDGLRPDGLQQADTPHVDALLRNGASSMTARTTMPSVTLPCHTSLFLGVETERHGITTNTWHPLARPVPSLIDVVHKAGGKTAAFYNWEELRDLSAPGSLDRSYFVRSCYDPEGDLELADVAAHFLARHEVTFAFVYFGYVDTAGHRYGWMTPDYLSAVHKADQAIGAVLTAMRRNGGFGDAAFVLTSDHGGHGKTHGTELDDDMLIPWVASGAGVPQGVEIRQSVSIVDTAPTVAAMLGVEPPSEWTGQVLSEVRAKHLHIER